MMVRKKSFQKIIVALLIVLFLMPPSFAKTEFTISGSCKLDKNVKPATANANTSDLKSVHHIVKKHVRKKTAGKRKRILALDGGGIKSIITLRILEYIEQKTGKKTGDYFDYITGSSSGGLLSLYLSIPSENDPKVSRHSATDVIEILKNDSKIIFKKKLASKIFGQKLVQIFRPAYHNKNIEAMMSARFKNLKVKDATTNILVTTFDTQENLPVEFTNYTKYYQDAYMREVAIGTSVAPFYLSPLVYHDKKLNRNRTLIDGGLVGKNTSVFAYCEAKNIFPKSDFFVLSLGAGYQEKKQYDYEKLKGWGFFRLSLPIYTFMLDGTSNTNNIYMQKLVQANKNDRYYRFQPILDPKTGFDNRPDNTSEANFDLLVKIADDYIIKHKKEIDAMIKDMIGNNKL